MPEREPIDVKNLDRYGFDALPWGRPREALIASSASPDVTSFLGTILPDGRPHSAGLGAIWYDGDMYFTCSPITRKARNLAANPLCTLSARLKGIDLVLEGEAHRVTDPATLEATVQIYRAERLKFASGDKFKGTPEEYQDASIGMSTHFGRYSFDAVRHTITFRIDRSSVPNQDDSVAVRQYELKGDDLSWRVAPRPDGSVPITTLRRAK